MNDFTLNDDHFELVYGLPHLHWKRIEEELDPGTIDELTQDNWDSMVEEWLLRLCHAMSDDTRVYASDDLIVVAEGDDPHRHPFHDFGRTCIHHVSRMLKGMEAVTRAPTPIVIHFADDSRFHDYIVHFYPESGSFGSVGGICLFGALPHIVLPPGDMLGIQSCLAHEMTHLLLCEADLPVWLDEALAQEVQFGLFPQYEWPITTEDVQLHQEFWSRHGLVEFWSGHAFTRDDDGQTLSYQLALVLLRTIRSKYRRKLRKFVEAARPEDAGDGAAKSVLGRHLDDFLTRFLGPGDWRPNPRQLRELEISEE